MQYELAKQLRDAGFPQGTGQYLAEDGSTGQGISRQEPSTTWCFVPTLSELIAACGKRFKSITLTRSKKRWNAVARKYAGEKGGDVFSENPEEAVANLWLALNKKS